MLGRSAYSEKHLGADTLRQLLCPIPLTQNHKLVAPMFLHPSDVLLVTEREQQMSPGTLQEINRRALKGAPLPCLKHVVCCTWAGRSPRSGGLAGEKVVMFDVSRGHERLPIPVYNGADDDPPPNNFTYVTECVASEGLRLLLGGPLRDPWPCPSIEGGAKALKKEQQAYADSPLQPIRILWPRAKSSVVLCLLGVRFLHPPHTIHSVYECSLSSGCGLDCRNRIAQRGPDQRLEVIRCMQTDGVFAKGWGVRSPDLVRKGSFVCEYIGEYISDDEAER